MPKSRRPSQERERTDDSLRQERLKTDAAAIGDRASVERDADDVVDHAREIADAVLSVARVKADDQWLGTPRLDETPLTLAGERAQADRTLTGERAAADGTLRTHRDARARFFAAALLAERAATDTYLLTERARSDDAIEHRDDFLRMVAHDLRNLLSGIVLNVELLGSAEGHPPSSESAAAAKRMLRSAARMNRLIGDLVDVTSIDAGKLAMAPVRNDAAALVAEATDTFRPAALEKGVALTAELPAGPLHAEFDHDRMLQVFANLIANAIKFTPRGGEIRVRVEDARATLRFCVSDTGVGIPEGMLDAVFERYWQVGKNDRRGQGLGLSISKSIVEAHHGRIWAESATGKGSRFHFTLPTHTSARRGIPARVPARDEARPSRRRERGPERRR